MGETAENKKLQNSINQINQKNAENSETTQQNALTFQAQYDEMQDQVDHAEAEVKKYKKELEELTNTLAETNAQKVNLEAQIDDLQPMVNNLQNQIAEKDESIKAIELDRNKEKKLREATFAEIDEKNNKILDAHKQLDEERRRNTELRANIDSYESNAKNQHLVEIEMADAERSMAELHQSLQSKTLEIEELKSSLKYQTERAEDKEKQASDFEKACKTSEEMGSSYKESAEKLKKDIEDMRESESVWKMEQARLLGQMETLKMGSDNNLGKLQDVQSEVKRLENENLNLQIKLQDLKKHYEVKIARETEKISEILNERQRLQNDYDSYKTRAATLLKQQKDSLQAENENAESNAKIQELQTKLTNSNNSIKQEIEKSRKKDEEIHILRKDHQEISSKYSELFDNYNSQDLDYKNRLKIAAKELNMLKSRHQNEVESLNNHNKSLKENFRQQSLVDQQNAAIEITNFKNEANSFSEKYEALKVKFDAQNREIIENKKLLKKLEEESSSNKKLIKQNSTRSTKNEPKKQSSSNNLMTTSISESAENLILDRKNSTEMNEGNNSSALQDLLNQSEIQSVWSTGSTQKASKKSSSHRHDNHTRQKQQEIKQLNLEIDDFRAQIKNINLLLKESEAENQRLDHQTNILKDEVRRYQKNQERQEDIHNLEYLKNVIVKFIKSEPGDEKKQLIPVIHMMLKLNPDEK